MTSDWVLIDTETTGFGNPIYPVEIAAQRMRGWNASGEPFRRLINQNVNISLEASRVNGYTREILERDGDSPAEVYRDFDVYVESSPICAYNLPYDFDQVLSPDWERNGIKKIGSRGVCILELTQRLLDPSPAGNCKLQTLRQFYRLPERGAHTALGDVLTVADLLQNVLQPIAIARGLTSWQSVWSYVMEPWYPRKIRMGKFKGVDFVEAAENHELRAWLEWLADSTNERTSSMGKWYLQQLETLVGLTAEPPIFVVGQASVESTGGEESSNSITIYTNPKIEDLKRTISLVRDRLAEVEANYTRERNAVNVVQAQLFSLLRSQYQKRDRLQNTVFYRRVFLDAVLRGEEVDATAQVDASAKANEEVDSEYENASKIAESQKPLTQSEEKELSQLYRKLVNLYHPDRFACDPEKADSYQKLTTAINQAREHGDIETLQDIARDPNAFMQRNHIGSLDFSDDLQVGKLRKLLESLEAELFNVLELLNNLLESSEYELYRLSKLDPKIVEVAAKEHGNAIEAEIEKLTVEADQLEKEIEMLTGESSGVK